MSVADIELAPVVPDTLMMAFPLLVLLAPTPPVHPYPPSPVIRGVSFDWPTFDSRRHTYAESAIPNPLYNSTEAALSRQGRYKTVGENLEVKEVVVGDGEGRQRYILVRNPERAARDKAKREDILQTLRDELAAIKELPEGQHNKAVCALVSHKVYGRWLTQTKTGKPRIDTAKVKADERLDGKYLLRCSDDTLDADEIALGYKGLYEVEEAFRTLKQRLELRPVYHRLEDRIRAHVLLCWLGLVVIRVAENRTGESWQKIRHCLGRMHLGQFAGPHGEAELRTATTPLQKRLLEALKVKEPPLATRLKA